MTTTTAADDGQGEAFIPRHVDHERSARILAMGSDWLRTPDLARAPHRPQEQPMTEQPANPAPFTLDDVPQSIPRERYVELIRALGLDPANVKRMEFRTDGVYVEVMYRNERGAQQLDEYVDEVVHHRVYIPVR